MGKIFRNNVTVTTVHNRRGKQFAFGVTHEPAPRVIFFPYWIIKAFEITSLDQGTSFDCLFVDQPEDKHPVVLAILDGDVLQESAVVGSYTGRPGTINFTAIVNQLNGAQA
jgi:hypothetical protein